MPNFGAKRLKKEGRKMQSECIWFRNETNDEAFWTRQVNFWFHRVASVRIQGNWLSHTEITFHFIYWRHLSATKAEWEMKKPYIYIYIGSYKHKKQSPSWEANRLVASQEIPRIFMETESSILYLQVPATCPYPELTPSSPHNPLQLPENPF
jgi:hypothetical protein